MFKVVDRPEFTHDVPIMVPVDGGHDEQILKTRFRLISNERWEELGVVSATDILDEIVVSFEDLVDASKAPLPCDPVVRTTLLGMPHVRIGLITYYRVATQKARLGN